MFSGPVAQFIQTVSDGIEVLAAIVVGYGALVAAFRALFHGRRRQREHFEHVRVDLGRTLTLGLELEIGADLLRVAQSPSWNRVGILAAIIAIRSGLNFLLQHDIEHLQQTIEAEEEKQRESDHTG